MVNRSLNLNEDRIKKLYESGKTITKIAKIIGCARSTVSLRLKSMGVKIKPRKINLKSVEKKRKSRALKLNDNEIKRLYIDKKKRLKLFLNYLIVVM